MKAFVTGTDGYIGIMLAEHLRRHGHQVLGCDTGFYRNGWLYNGSHYIPETLSKDIRQVTEEDMQGCDAVIHLAELSNDPLGQLAPNITFDINHKGSVHLARVAEQCGVRRFIYFSSCSVYGASDDVIDESGSLNPQTAYAQCKVKVEEDLGKMASPSFVPTFLRNATAYGASPRQRFDLVVNNLAGFAWCTKEIKMTSDGTPWRPLVHILDICKAARCALEADEAVVHNETFNVGDSNENYQVRQVAEIVGQTFPGCEVTIGDRAGDKRDYKVSFDKIAGKLPGFRCEWNVKRGAEQLLSVFEQIQLTTELFESAPHTRIKQITHLLDTGQIDSDFFWREPESGAA
ncbi:MAG TPA: SDR family oxidoreductase [Gammaproteobacteria bacterium]|nr:SDR family oxidoreductase [Gammaproteobacteria bacterium]